MLWIEQDTVVLLDCDGVAHVCVCVHVSSVVAVRISCTLTCIAHLQSRE